MQDLKQCKACGEEIKSIAKRCPHCQAWQSKWHIEQSDPRFTIFVFIILFAVMGSMMWSFISNLWSSDFQDYISDITITESRINHGEDKHGDFISIVGKIRNDSKLTWENIYFEVQFYNKSNKLIDSLSANERDLVLLPNSESSFSIRGRPDVKEEVYDNYKVILKKGRESDKFFKW